MSFIKSYWFVPIGIILIFLLEYFLMINYIEKYFQFNDIIKEEVLEEEKTLFRYKIILKGVIIILQFIAGILCINIGMIFFKYKVKIKEIVKVVLQSLVSVIVIQSAIILFMWIKNYIFSIKTIESVEDKLYITNYINEDKISSFLLIPLETFNLTHLLFVLILAFGLRVLINKKYLQALVFTLKTYGIGVSIWFVFAMIMEMNFN